MAAEYSTIAVNRTPEINPGETIEIDIYWSGSGVPEKNRLYISYNPVLLDSENPGEVRTFVKKAVDRDSGEVSPVSGEDYVDGVSIGYPGTHVGLVETTFFPDPDSSENGGFLTGRVSERNHDNHPPVEVRINTDRCPAGDYTIPIILNYAIDDDIKQDRENVDVHVRSWVEKHRRKLEVIGLIGVIATIGILAASLFAIAANFLA